MFDLDIDKLKAILIEQHENDEKQLEVIFSEAPRVIVEAPAGYGKTTTMISRIAYLYTAGKIPNPKRILALTFSVNAALKIKRDIAEKLPRLIGEKNNPTAINEKVTATNYHGFCKGILQKHGYLISSILRKDVNSFKALGDSDVSRNLELKSVLDVKEMSVLTGMEETIKSGTVPTDDKVNEYNALVIEKLLPLNIITHNAVILFTIKLLESYPQISTFYQNYYPLLIIDEFQDTNCIAWKLICNLISTNTQLLFLGDPLQRIYGFIGALPDIMTIAANDYSMQQIVLTKNYRFRHNQEMLKLDANVRRNAAEDFNISFNDEEIAELPAFYGKDQDDEAQQIAAYVKQLLEKNAECKIAMLCRARGNNSNVLEKALSDLGIDYFYGMFTDEDESYVSFHQKCQEAFIKKFAKTKNINNRSLNLFVQDIKSEYGDTVDKTKASLLTLLDALATKVATDYAIITPEDKFSLLLDIFENRQLRQAMEYVNSNVIISTVHGAKGLEWEYVFLADLEKWVFPSFLCGSCVEKSSTPVRCRCHLPSRISQDFYKSLIEELSVFYVGITRARKQVYVSASKIRINAKNETFNTCFSCMVNLDGIKLIQAK